ncbi:MAG: DUF3575 domain-containing protein [Bacteroidota bacterium]|nr:DUF3575 domain-containing protein [Bacteroidota bacterium]MDP4268523.1 DUF3575 domain-containing protein [Bacteroidota bacterium]
MQKIILIYALTILFTSEINGQFYSLGTNIPALGTTTLNMEASMTLNRKWSAHLPVYYNPFVFKDNKRLQNFTLLPGVRYWLLESYVNTFAGVNAIGSKYHLTFGNNRYEGQAYGMGLSVGHAWLLSPRWNLEIEGGFGYVWTDYVRYECEECGRKRGELTRWMLVPNKVGFSIVYLF